ncbi:MAG: hypothetical protein ACKV2V_06990 [Blastocatellia bacterium]
MTHNCKQTEELLTALLPDGAEPAAREQALAGLARCARCQAEYMSLRQALQAYDRTIDSAMPDQTYWPGYEARMRARMNEAAAPGVWRRALTTLSGLWVLPAPVYAMAAILLALGAWWMWRATQTGAPAPVIVHNPARTPGAAPTPHAPEPTPAPTGQTPMQLANNRRLPVTAVTPRRQTPANQALAPPELTALTTGIDPALMDATLMYPALTGSALTEMDTARHFEKAQLLLRAFRNARTAGTSKGGGADIAYEKQLSRRLLYQNILLRRTAEARGNLPVETTLNTLEPFLLDIANLPRRASRDDVAAIRERMAQQEIVAVLQTQTPADLAR